MSGSFGVTSKRGGPSTSGAGSAGTFRRLLSSNRSGTARASQGQTILLFAEQGLGDTLQFIRYAPLVKQTGATVIVQCPGPLLRLLATCAGIDRLVPEGTDPPPFDVQAPLLEPAADLPHNPGDHSRERSRIWRLTPNCALDWQQQLSGVEGFKVGIAWQGNPEHTT